MSTRNQTSLPRLLTALVVVALLLPAVAFAGHDEKIEYKFVGFGTNPDFYGIHLQDEIAGDSLLVFQVGTPTPIASYPLEGTSLSKALKSAEIAPYALTDKGITGETAEQGYTLVGKTFGAQFQLSLKMGAEEGTLGYVAVVSDPTRTEYAAIKVKSVHWTKDGTRVVVILNQKLGGEWPMDSDTLAAYSLAAPAPAPAP
ncbi:MAG: hypothetical protein AUK47_23945 [Deltaproteobacteria bacterium CG2_30_63_29]|nr:MAG: hypothetical protein AUK47_23945 [Deltaproteobacteria bacterium CG2_30_63_29]PIV99916.1 MAG: hypothetical protein COW42_09485 [Deltaproteobacteria bacterium CG17_big_fil_post_rev_8_21_14_2_50_63_7]PJB35899.1 MAG: hypothetical protein CO108_24530 [Deltaproteobacteria bacterium CG_4_9_14_3_um_filter_63_12]